MATKKPTFSRAGKSFSSGMARDIKDLFNGNLTFRSEKNLFLGEDLSEDETEAVMASHISALNENVFSKFKPQWKTIADNKILSGTASAYRVDAMDIGGDLKDLYSFDINKKLLCLYSCVNDLLSEDRIRIEGKDIDDEDFSEEGDVLSRLLTTKALDKMVEEGKVISVLKEAKGIYADVTKLADKYSIRLGDGKYFVASDDVQVTFRDPAENPGWAMWFLNAVPLTNIPDRAKMVFQKAEDVKCPEVIADRPIICHASLWELGQSSGVLLHTSWNNIAVSYRWKIDKPIEIASLLFKAVSHPAHIARNFGYAPQMTVPGNDWF